MPRTRGDHTPTYRFHKSSGQALVAIEGRCIYLGEYGSAKSRAAYVWIIAEWLANGRRLPSSADDLTINEVILQY